MGHRMELYCDESLAKDIIRIAKSFKVESKIIGLCEPSLSKKKNSLEIKSEFGSFDYKQNNIN
jgi:phosphoribosylformylglycinamidine cyclo-ligase